jgi:isoleucyl-tRNA synthetase
MKRVPELIDVWFDSGNMPFAQHHYPFEQKDFKFPADYICEAIDQTRGWFYTLLAIATLLGFEAPYKNVISVGHVLDTKGEKMSKSKGNIVDPWQLFDKYGADAMRWYFYTINQPGEPKLFNEKDIDAALKKFILIYWNSFVFFQTYKNKEAQNYQPSKNALDQWIVSKLNSLIEKITTDLEKYNVLDAARSIEDFTVNELSLWYIRRSRKRFEEAQNTLGFVLATLTRLMAPFLPFLSEKVYRDLTGKESVHLEDWPKAEKKLIDQKLEAAMVIVREIVTSGLAERAKAGIKVRQPLASLEIIKPKVEIPNELLNLIKEEINVKEIILGKELKLNTELTEELKEEGAMRDIIRQIQEMRKQSGLKPQDRVDIIYRAEDALVKIIEKYSKNILSQVQADSFIKDEKLEGPEIIINNQKLCLSLVATSKSL